MHRYLYLASNIIGNKILSNIILYYNNVFNTLYYIDHMIIIYIKNVNRSYLNIYRDQRGSLKLLKME